jgi:hypothetical protein
MIAWVFIMAYAGCLILVVMFLVFLVFTLTYRWLPGPVKRWGCRVLHWHIGHICRARWDGCNMHSTCVVCGKEVMQDSQGNWF